MEKTEFNWDEKPTLLERLKWWLQDVRYYPKEL